MPLSFFLVAAILACALVFFLPAKKALNRKLARLSATDQATYRALRQKNTAIADMPPRYSDVMKAAKKISRIWMASMAAGVAALFWITMAGPNLGLPLTP